LKENRQLYCVMLNGIGLYSQTKARCTVAHAWSRASVLGTVHYSVYCNYFFNCYWWSFN